MKYKVGDKVKVRTWEDMKNLYGLNPENYYDVEHKMYFKRILVPGGGGFFFDESMEIYVESNYSDRIVQIIKKNNISYHVDESNWNFQDYMIEGIVEIDERDIIQSRFELLDI